MGLNLASILTESAGRFPDAPGDPARRGRAHLRRPRRRSPRAWRRCCVEKGIGPGDRVGVMLPNVPEFPVAYYGVLRAGAVVVPMNVLLKRREIAFYLQDSGAELLLAWHGFCAEARDGAADAGAELIEVEPASFAETLRDTSRPPGLAETAEDDTAVILYTSGTTGKPKGAELTHANLSRNAEISSRTTCEVGPGDVVLGALPLFHSFGQTVGDERLAAGRRLPHPGAEIRPGRGAGDDAARRRHPLLRRADDVRRAAPPPRARELRHLDRCATASPAAPRCRSRSCAASKRPSGRRCWRATASRRPRPSPRSNHPDMERKAGLDRHPDRGGRDAGRRRGRQRGRAGRGRRDRDPRPQHHEGLLAAARGDRGGDARRLVPQRRHGPHRRGRLLLHRRPQEGPDHPRRLQRLPARGRGGALRAPEDPRSRGRRHPPRRVGRGDRRRGRPPRRRGAAARGGQRLRQGADRRLQVPAGRLVHRRPAEGPDRQDPQARDRALRPRPSRPPAARSARA